MTTYKIRRFRFKRPTEIIKTGLTLEEAQEHCEDPTSRGEDWFDGWTEEEEENNENNMDTSEMETQTDKAGNPKVY